MNNKLNEEVAEAILNTDMEDLYRRIKLYFSRRSKTEKELKNLDLDNLIQRIFEKALNGTRNWDSSKCSFREFIFGVLKSEIHNYKRKLLKENKKTLVSIDEHLYLTTTEKERKELEQIKTRVINELNKLDATDNEILIFDCWTEGEFKAKEIAELLDLPPNKVYSIKYKLLTKLDKIQPIITEEYYG